MRGLPTLSYGTMLCISAVHRGFDSAVHVLAMLLSATLFVVVQSTKSPSLRAYKRVLKLTCVIELCLSTTTLVTQPLSVITDTTRKFIYLNSSWVGVRRSVVRSSSATERCVALLRMDSFERDLLGWYFAAKYCTRDYVLRHLRFYPFHSSTDIFTYAGKYMKI